MEEEPGWPKGNSSGSNMKGINNLQNMRDRVLQKASRRQGWDTRREVTQEKEWHQ